MKSVTPVIFLLKTSLLISTLLVLRTHGGNVDHSCSNSASDCVCSIESAREDMQRHLLNYGYGQLEEKLRTYKCVEHFERLPKLLMIDASQAPFVDLKHGRFRQEGGGDSYSKRRLRRKRRQVRLGVPTDEVFNEAIAQLNPRAFHQYAVLGSAVQFPCTGPNVDILDEIDPHGRRFKWSHYSGAPITAPQSMLNKETGVLSLRSIQLSDTGVYNCTIEFSNDETGEIESRIFSHQLSVVSEPIFSLKFSLHYTTDSCERQEKILIAQQLTPWIFEYICPNCRVHNTSVRCVHGNHEVNLEDEHGQRTSPREYEIGLIVSVAGLDLKFSKSQTQYENLQSCSMSCSEIYQARLLEIVRDSMVKLFSLPIEIFIGNGNQNIVHNPIPETLEMTLLLGCLAGFHLNYKLCFPCDVGHFSPDANSNCYQCSIGHYQPLPGSSSCIPCGIDLNTVHTGSISESDCVIDVIADISTTFSKHGLVIGIVIGLILLIIILLVTIRGFCAQSALGKFVTGYCCCCCPAKERYGYEDSPSNDIRMTDISNKNPKSHQKRKSSSANYTKLSNEKESTSTMPKSRNRDKTKNAEKLKLGEDAASNIRLIETEFEEVEEQQEDPNFRRKEIWRVDEEELDNQSQFHSRSRKSKEQNQVNTKSKSISNSEATDDGSICSTNTHRIGLHRCVKPSLVKSTLNDFAVERMTADAGRKKKRLDGNGKQSTIPPPPPLPKLK